jgi:hypothetical protein
MQTLTDQERADGALKWAEINKSYGATVFTDDEIRDHWYQLAPLEQSDSVENLTELDRVSGAQKMAMTNKMQGTTVFTPDQIRAKWFKEDPELGRPLTPQEAVPIGAPERITAKGTPPTMSAAEQYELLKVLEAAVESGNTEVIDRILGLRHLEHKLSSTQIALPEPISQQLLALGALIPYEDLNLEEGGREQDAHVTVKYGLHTESSLLVQHILQGYGTVHLTLGTLDVFQGDGYDVLYAKVDSPELVALNKFISEQFEVTDTHPDFKPHATIAYLKPGLGAQYVGRSELVGLTVTTNKLTFSSADDVKSEISLT